MFDDIRRGGTTTPKRPNVRDRGLTVKHLMRFFDSTAWSGFDDSDTVRTVSSTKWPFQLRGYYRDSSLCIETYSHGWRAMKFSMGPTWIIHLLVIRHGFGHLRKGKRLKQQRPSIHIGLLSPPQKNSCGWNNGMSRKHLTEESDGIVVIALDLRLAN